MSKNVAVLPDYTLNVDALARIKDPWSVQRHGPFVNIVGRHEEVDVVLVIAPSERRPNMYSVMVETKPVDPDSLTQQRVCGEIQLAVMLGNGLRVGGVNLFGEVLQGQLGDPALDDDAIYAIYRLRMADDLQKALGTSLSWSAIKAEVLSDRLTLELMTASLVDHVAMSMALYDETAFAVYFMAENKQITVPDFANHRQTAFLYGPVSAVLGSLVVSMTMLAHVGYMFPNKHAVPVQTGATMLIHPNDDPERVASECMDSFLHPVSMPKTMRDYNDRYGDGLDFTVS